ncbi:MAG: lipid-A-disaccharide synthase [Planctomycetota bacterium]
MRLPVPVRVALVLARELLRALAFPLHCAAYLVQRGSWERSVKRALTAPVAAPTADPDVAELLPAQPTGAARRPPHIFVSTGEPSGETHAAAILRAVNEAGVEARWSGFGGPALRDAGADVLAPLSEHPIMGVRGVLHAVPFLVRVVARFIRVLRDDRPDLVVLVDYPGLHMVLGQLAREHGVPVLHYIAPQLWAWAPWRMRRYRGCVDATLTILPFEPAYFGAHGVRATYVGSPVLDHLERYAAAGQVDVRAFRTVGLMPGSRRSELVGNLPHFIELARGLRADHPDLRFVLPHVDERRAPLIRELLAAHDGDAFIDFVAAAPAQVLRDARVVLAKSGTGSLEVSLCGVPTVVVYKIHGWFSDLLYRKFITVPWIGASNLIAGRQVVPEQVFADDAGWARVDAAVRELLEDGPPRRACIADLTELRARLGEPGADARVAAIVVRHCGLAPTRTASAPAR